MDLNHYKNKIKQSRKNTDFKQFVKEIMSWTPLVFHRNNGLISRWPDTDRVKICSIKGFNESRDDLIKTTCRDYNFEKDFFNNYSKLLKSIKFPNLLQF